MPSLTQPNTFSVKTYRGDAKTLLAFDLPKSSAKNLAGFTIQVTPNGQPSYYLQNELRFADPAKHAQDTSLPANSSLNAPIHKFRWVHVLGSTHQGTHPFYGPYTYTITPRYFDGKDSLLAIDPKLSSSVTVDVAPFAYNEIELGFTRGFTQSQAFVHHFGPKALFRPKGKDLLFDTTQVSGRNSAGKEYTFADEYEWLGFTAREKIFSMVNEVLSDKSLHLDVFAYDLNEPDLMKAFLQIGKEGRMRIILDNASLHHNASNPKPEDQFERLFNGSAKPPAAVKRGMFGRYAHDKVLVVSKNGKALKVLTGSTNFSVTGLYVNSNHVLLFNDPDVASAYGQVFNVAWNANMWNGKKSIAFARTPEAGQVFSFNKTSLPKTAITFSPHINAVALKNLDDLAARITQEGKQDKASVLFAVMGLATGQGPVLPALKALHTDQHIFSYGISDSPGGICLYTRRKKTGVLVTGKPVGTKLPPPFDQVPGVGIGHQIHHKFVVCGFNGDDPVVYFGSSNLTLGGEEANGDNLIEIRDKEVATVFAIEALALVDHFDFLNRSSSSTKASSAKIRSASTQQQAVNAGWFLSTTDAWTVPYFDPRDLHCVDRQLFG